MEASFIYDLIVCMYLGKIAWVDFKTLKIKNKSLLYLGLILAIRLMIFNIDLEKIIYALLINLIIFGVIYFYPKQLMGAGDLKLALVLALWCKYPQCIVAIYVSFIFGGIVAIYFFLKNINKISKKEKISFAPMLILGNIISFFEADNILNLWLSFIG